MYNIKKSSYVLASEISCAGKIILSHSDEVDEQKIKDTIDYINLSLKDIGCKRQIGMSDIKKGILNLTDEDLKEIANLREENPEATLEQLGAMLKNPIGKSSVSHRFKKIEEYL